jgi:hypothetical protein
MVNMLEAFKQELAKAQEAVAFWEKAVAVASDPRAAQYTTIEAVSGKKIYGDLQHGVLQVLPEPGTAGIPVTAIVSMMESGGYSFTSKFPNVAVNEALKSLSEKQKAVSVGKNGIAKLWTKATAGATTTTIQ